MRDHLPGMSIYHMVPLEANIDSHYFKRLQTLQVFCNNLYCLIRTLSKLAHSACVLSADVRLLGAGLPEAHCTDTQSYI